MLGIGSVRRVLTGVAVASLALGTTTGVATVHGASPPAFDPAHPTRIETPLSGVGGFRTTNTIPYWSSSFTYKGQTYDYTMAGAAPSTNASTTIPVEIIPVKFTFPANSNYGGGNWNDVFDPYSVDPAYGLSVVQGTLDSPIFAASTYPDGVGTTQFGDAIQRATFNKTGTNGYHVSLAPSVVPEQTITVPSDKGRVFSTFAETDISWFAAQMGQMMGALHIDPHTLAIILTNNVYTYVNNNPDFCCITGFHGAAEFPGHGVGSTNGNGDQPVQTYVYSAWVSPGIFKYGDGFPDVNTLGHEVAEWLNDPFADNSVPPWQSIGPFTFCQGNLETGDVLEALPYSSYPVTLNGVMYHPQNEALLPWFERQSPSTAVNGAYSFPDTTAASTFAQDC